MRFRKKPIEVVAIHFDGSLEGIQRALDFLGRKGTATNTIGTPVICISEREGELRVVPGDWIIKGVDDEFYPCRPDVFDRTYEACE